MSDDEPDEPEDNATDEPDDVEEAVDEVARSEPEETDTEERREVEAAVDEVTQPEDEEADTEGPPDVDEPPQPEADRPGDGTRGDHQELPTFDPVADIRQKAVQPADVDAKAVVDEIAGEGDSKSSYAEADSLRRQADEIEERARTQELVEGQQAYAGRAVAERGIDPDRPITAIPPIPDEDMTQVELKPIREDRSYVRILYDEDESQYLYQVIEPQLTDEEEEIQEFLRDTLVRTVEGRKGRDRDWLSYLRQAVDEAIVDHNVMLDRVGRHRVLYYLERDFLGYDKIDVMMTDPMIEDISCDGPGIPIYVFHRQYESTKTDVVFEDEDELDSFVLTLAQRAGKHISLADPLLDATLPDTSRLQATLSREVTTRGSSFTIRRFQADPLTPPDLVRIGTINAEVAAYLWLAMEHGSNIIFGGGTASGKTTTLNSAAQFIPPNKKIVTIEDTREINLEHENWVAGLTRTGFGGGEDDEAQGDIDMYDLLESALRQRPEYLIVGEVRGPEARTLFQAMATGHATYSTLHADSAKTAVYRLENEPINVPRQMLSSLDLLGIQTQVRLEQKMVRRLSNLVEIVGIEPDTGDMLTNTVFQWQPSTDDFEWRGDSEIFEEIAERNNRPLDDVYDEMDDRAEIIDWMVGKGIRHIDDVSRVINAYYSRPDAVLERVRGEEE